MHIPSPWPALSAALVATFAACSTSSPPAPLSEEPASPQTRATDDGGAAQALCVVSPEPAPFAAEPCGSPRAPSQDALDEALGKIGLDRCGLRLYPADIATGSVSAKDKRRLADFDSIHPFPLRLPGYGRTTAAWLDEALRGPTPVSSAIAAAAARRNAPVTECADPSWFAFDPAADAPLAVAIEAVSTAYEVELDLESLRMNVALVPLELQRALVPVVHALAAANARIGAVRAAASAQSATLAQVPQFIRGFNVTISNDALRALDAFDVASLQTAATQVATAIEAGRFERFRNLELAAVDLETPFGLVALRGPEPDTYEPDSTATDAAFLLDVGGDDNYRIPAGATSSTRGISVLVDLAGADRYGYREVPVSADKGGHRLPSDGRGRTAGVTLSTTARQGAGVLGVGLLFDLGIEPDVYRSLTSSQGAGFLGVGVLYDAGGDDSFTAESLSQGASAWGLGLLLDRAGADHYTTYTDSQGFGFTQGVGVLVDTAGDDEYFADPGEPSLGGDPLYPSAQLPGPPQSHLAGNGSGSQGCGFGFRAGSPAPNQFAGGMGILRDTEGHDRYVAGVFAQGCAYGLGIGLFLEGGGDDTYEGLWYVQGSNAHTAVALFLESGGSDRYNPTFPVVATSLGVGHDLSVTVHLDENGDDRYRAPGLSMGSGNVNGIGLLVNVGGSDRIEVPDANTLGAANATEVKDHPRRNRPTLGVFVRAGGPTEYVVGGKSTPERQSGEWSYTPNRSTNGGPDGGVLESGERSIGLDRPRGTALLP